MKYQVFNSSLFLWREDIGDSVVLYKIGGEKFFHIKGKLKTVFLQMVDGPCNMENGQLKDFFLSNEIFMEVDQE